MNLSLIHLTGRVAEAYWRVEKLGESLKIHAAAWPESSVPSIYLFRVVLVSLAQGFGNQCSELRSKAFPDFPLIKPIEHYQPPLVVIYLQGIIFMQHCQEIPGLAPREHRRSSNCLLCLLLLLNPTMAAVHEKTSRIASHISKPKISTQTGC